MNIFESFFSIFTPGGLNKPKNKSELDEERKIRMRQQTSQDHGDYNTGFQFSDTHGSNRSPDDIDNK